ncbi:NUDIX domain-containing protein [Pseudomonas sp. SZ57]|uniref:NUDIX hydrolase n=1 Tax=Pseudomonas TaxID=286 RepID=UPI000C1CBFBC|nr:MULTISPECIES: NUDIX domain-containing protein [Pseudomonas]MCF9000823.1 NUDIX domain-containing protein [Pseudomonas syringae]MCL6305448.1 NUDIX domain-containing protein [Pseudomonas syringae]MQQ32996.1 NUDIX domain-containing protein [Pseudomonas sp. SZ57]PIO95513.1 DNA mismatch repair protein MutT [Pseudomonas syringae]POP77840.1 NUDIX domain-containing protein [Pseudomonas syringae pv. syringae]
MEFTRDRFNGIIVNAASLPNDPQALQDAVDALVILIENEGLALAWVTLPISNAQSIPIFTAAGFSFHSCLTDQLTLVRRPLDQVFVPFIPTHTVGAGAIVINEAGELLVVKERGTQGFKLPGGHVDNAERIQDSIEREVLEETGIESKFESIVAFTTKHPYQFGKSNIHFICRMTALTQRINILDTAEIEEAKWVALQAYLADDSNSMSNRQLLKDVAFSQGLVPTEYSANVGAHKKQEIFTTTGDQSETLL